MSADDYIYFEEEPPTGKVTRVVTVRNRRSSDELGKIRWYGPWRQYCFFPTNTSIFNPDCMTRITREVVAMQSAYRAK